MPTSDKVDLERIARALKLPLPDEVDEGSLDYASEAGHFAYEGAIKEGMTEKQAEKEREKAEIEAQDETYHQYHGAVMAAADRLFEKHGLGLMPLRKSERYPFEFKIIPIRGETWGSAAKWIVQTIDGVGMFEIPAEDYAGERKAKEFVLTHWGHIRHWPEVYGERSARDTYEKAWR